MHSASEDLISVPSQFGAYARMINDHIQNGITIATERFWSQHILSAEFRDRATGKEVGHRIADYVEEQTVRLLDEHFTTGYQYNQQGNPVDRGMADIWIRTQGIYNPLNVKSGESGKNGQPNMVSLKKILKALIQHRIDSYYLLIIKFDFACHVATVYLTDILDILEFTHFDSGPGQIMLRESRFYEAMDAGHQPNLLSLPQKIDRLIEILEDGDRRLFENRKRKTAELIALSQQYQTQRPIDQTAFRIR